MIGVPDADPCSISLERVCNALSPLRAHIDKPGAKKMFGVPGADPYSISTERLGRLVLLRKSYGPCTVACN